MSIREYNTKKTNSWIKTSIKPKNIPQSEFVKACNTSSTMSMACAKLGLHFDTFKKYALKYNCYKPNQSGKGVSKNIICRLWDFNKWNNDEIFNTQRAVIRGWIIKFKLIEYKCNKCNIFEWGGMKLSLELNHINGNNWEHRKNNLEWLCPNCHSQTLNYRGRNK